ncbi:class I SAM-dependent methyltransferase [Arthrobacter sp. B3I4]|uniref:class I SAM-dependent DNA methyltransferase n=1 Tax=Arthrobacter sp. B3I4 TaxID=3042267 RepID=UPI00278487A0|nr:class I SAM-dependent methyltransferase [Arthrobacter sp. B3I4]MDQ0754658.1 SAM-dependent methyltransferase [Arthrobacter sp. B3I4]
MENSGNLARVRTVYDMVAETYAAVLPDTSFEAPEDLALINEFSARLRGAAGHRVVDAGCGTGRMSAYLSGAGLQVTGVDLSPGMVRTAQRLHPRLTFAVGGLAELPVADAAVDGVFAWYSIIHSAPAALSGTAREFWRVLRPGGLALVAFHVGSGHRTLQRAYGHDVELRLELHRPDDVGLRFAGQGFVPEMQLLRAARGTEKHPQAALVMSKPKV